MTNPKLEDQLNQADLDIKDGYLEAAVLKLNSILATDPNFGKAYNHLGFIYETKFKDYDKAMEYYQKAIELSPEYVATYNNFAILLSTLKEYDDLFLLLDKALKVRGINKATIYNEYGIMYESLEQYDEAIKNYREAIRNCLDNSSMERYEQSVERIKRKIDLFN